MSDKDETDWELPAPDETVEYVIQIDKWFFGDNEEYRVIVKHVDDDEEITGGNGYSLLEALKIASTGMRI